MEEQLKKKKKFGIYTDHQVITNLSQPNTCDFPHQFCNINWESNNSILTPAAELVTQAPQVRGSVPHGCPHFSHSVVPGCPHLCPTDYNFRGSCDHPLGSTIPEDNPQNSGKHFTYGYQLIVKDRGWEQLRKRRREGVGGKVPCCFHTAPESLLPAISMYSPTQKFP